MRRAHIEIQGLEIHAEMVFRIIVQWGAVVDTHAIFERPNHSVAPGHKIEVII
jgi:hypothetical protein